MVMAVCVRIRFLNYRIYRGVGLDPLFLLDNGDQGLNATEIIRQAWKFFEPALREQAYELVEVEYVRPGGAAILRIYIDKADSGITHEDCVAATQTLNPVLDVEDFIAEDYSLEVSSPGLDRPVRKPEDFKRFVGKKVKMSTHAPLEGRRRFTGVLKGFEEDMILVECDGKSYEIHVENLKKANLNR